MGANESEQADSLWLRLQLLLGTDREVIHSDQMDFALVFFFIYRLYCVYCEGGSVVHSVASQHEDSGIELQLTESFLCY